MKRARAVRLLLLFLPAVWTAAPAWADTIVCSDGRIWEGLIRNEDDRKIYLDLGFDTAALDKRAVESVRRSSAQEVRVLEERLESRRVHAMRLRRTRAASSGTVPAIAAPAKGAIVVDTLLNGRVRARLVVDTGANVVVITPRIARALGLDTRSGAARAHLAGADGLKLDAAAVVLDKVNVQGTEARRVTAVALLEEPSNPEFYDGLLGMSFLGRYVFRIDPHSRRLVLED